MFIMSGHLLLEVVGTYIGLPSLTLATAAEVPAVMSSHAIHSLDSMTRGSRKRLAMETQSLSAIR